MSGHRTSGAPRARLLTLRIAAAALFSLAACGQIFGLDDGGTDEIITASGASAGRGMGGAHASGTGGRAGRGGTGNAGVAAGALGGAAGDGSVGGSTAGDGGHAGEVQHGGASGAGAGSVPDDRREQFGASCSDDGAYACSDASRYLVLTCQGGVWVEQTTCRPSARCDHPKFNSFCTELEDFCVKRASDGPICDGNEIVNCDPDEGPIDRQVCPFGCRNGACDPGTPGSLTLHTGPTPFTEKRWNEAIPVCFATDGEDAERIGWIRDEIEHVYNRYYDVEFIGFEACASATTGVVLSFADDCRGSLVNDIGAGYPDQGESVAVSICKSYFDPVDVDDDSGDEPSETDESLTRLLARHQFGHVLGLLDGGDARQTMMVRGVERGRENELVPRRADYFELSGHLGYARKRRESLVTPTGLCATAASLIAGAALSVSSCIDASPPQTWSADPSGITLVMASPQLRIETSATTNNRLLMAPVDITLSPERLRLARAQWRTVTECVAPERQPPTEGMKLLAEPCVDVGHPSQSWHFETVSVNRPYGVTDARLHFGDSGLCAAAPHAEPSAGDILELSTCSTSIQTNDRQIFLLAQNTGQIHFGAMAVQKCIWLQDPAGVLTLEDCGALSTWILRGALEDEAGTALTIAGKTLVATPLETPPASNQIFDFYF